jgi:ppGpp synthetase/RelA/SpoT-type nucleotidyltranferase
MPSYAKSSDLNALQPNGYRSLHLVAERHGQPFEALQVQWPK